MKPLKHTSNDLFFLSGGGEMGRLTREFDWSKTPVGAPDQWPQNLRTTIGILLHSAFPMFLWWGDDLIQFYNDAYRPSLGNDGKHPLALGQKGADCWPETWETIHPLMQEVRETREATWREDQLIPIYRNGKLEDVYWTFSYSPVFGDSGGVDGILVTCSETTEKVRMFRRLAESEKRFQMLIRQATLGIVVLGGEENTIEIVNEAYARMANSTVEALQSQPIFRVSPESEPYFRPILDKVRKSGQPYTLYGYPYFMRGGGEQKESYMNIVYQPYRENDGNVSGIMVLCQDVSEEVFSRKKVEETESRMRAMVENAPFPIGVYTGREMRIELANQSIMDIWGKGSDVIGRLYSEILPELENQEVYQQLESVYTTGIPFHARNQHLDLVVDGKLQPFYFNYSFTPLYDANGKIYGVMNTGAEVTDLNVAKEQLEQSERNLRNIVLQAPVAMTILLGADHVIEVVNQLMLALWGKEAADILHRPAFEVMPYIREQGLEELLRFVYESGESYKGSERPVEMLRNGEMATVFVDFVIEPYRGSDGEVLGVLLVAIDVTDQVQARQLIEKEVHERTKELASANDSLKKSNAELAQFAHIASHDLQEPLRKISIFSEMLATRAEEVLDEPSKNYLNKINNSANRMNTLVREVLSYSELNRGSELFESVDLNEIIDGVLGDYDLLIEQKKADISYDRLPVVEAIPLQMSQLFGNLIGNALKFTRPDVQPQITIRLSVPDADEKRTAGLEPFMEYFRLQIRDNGIGIKPEHTEQIFHIFQRLHRKSDYEGTGIGLAMCKKIALNHNGDLNAGESSEAGAVFTLFLPYRQPQNN